MHLLLTRIARLTDLLADPAADVRVAAALALGSTGKREAALPLRLKVLSGDDSAEVLCACFNALLNLDEAAAVGFIGRFLYDEGETVRVSASIALGQSGHHDALEILTACWKHHFGERFRADVLMAIALLRYPRAIEFLVSLVEGGGRDAEDSLRALATVRRDPQILVRVEAAVDRTAEPSLMHIFSKIFQ
jgi:HEAT repeat protein